MVNPELARTIVGVIGNVISFFLFLSPVPTFITIWKQKSVEEFKPEPYVVTALNCAMWVFYGMPFVHPDSTLVVTINGTGLVIELIYVAIFLTYSTGGKRKKILIMLLIELIFFTVCVFIVLLCFHGSKDRSMIVGIICIVFNIGMYASPLTVMRNVIRTKSVKYMPFTLSLANFANGIVWASYALIKFDPYILIPNGLGVLSGIVQLVLYATFYSSTVWDDDNDEKRSEVQMSAGTSNV